MLKSSLKRFFPVLMSVLLLTGWAASAAANTNLDSDYGTPMDEGSGRSAAMGGVGVALLQGSSAVFQNPATLALSDGRFSFDFDFGMNQANEDRFIPLFDGFDNYVAETAIAMNRNTYGFAEGGVLVPFSSRRPMVLSVGVHNRYDVRYDYFEEVRDPDRDSLINDTILQLNEAKSDGVLRAFSVGYGTEFVHGFNVGFAMHRYYGTLTQMVREAPVGLAADVIKLERDLSGTGFSLGAHIQASERLGLGLSFEGPFTVDGAHLRSISLDDGAVVDTLAGDFAIDYPGALSFGFSFHPRNQLRTTFSIQATRRYWEKLEDSYFDAEAAIIEDAGLDAPTLELRDTWDLRMGLEHIFYNGMPMRLGLRYVENYFDKESYRTVFSVGTGYEVGGGYQIGVTGQYHRQTSLQDYVFESKVPGYTAPAQDVKVEDSLIRLVVGVSRVF